MYRGAVCRVNCTPQNHVMKQCCICFYDILFIPCFIDHVPSCVLDLRPLRLSHR